jgi:hypothetical protein
MRWCRRQERRGKPRERFTGSSGAPLAALLSKTWGGPPSTIEESKSPPCGPPPSRAFRSTGSSPATGGWLRLTSSAHPTSGRAIHLFGLGSLGAAQAQGQADHNFCHFIFRQHRAQSLPVLAFVLALNRIQALGGDAKRVGNGNPDPLRPDIEGENAARMGHRTIMAGGGANVKAR